MTFLVGGVGGVGGVDAAGAAAGVWLYEKEGVRGRSLERAGKDLPMHRRVVRRNLKDLKQERSNILSVRGGTRDLMPKNPIVQRVNMTALRTDMPRCQFMLWRSGFNTMDQKIPPTLHPAVTMPIASPFRLSNQ
jgi:hypothetical protein